MKKTLKEKYLDVTFKDMKPSIGWKKFKKLDKKVRKFIKKNI